MGEPMGLVVSESCTGGCRLASITSERDAAVAERERVIDQAAEALDALHARLVAAEGERDALREALRQAAIELEADHLPQWASAAAKDAGKQPIGCRMCFPGDGSWPCASKMITDDLRAALGPSEAPTPEGPNLGPAVDVTGAVVGHYEGWPGGAPTEGQEHGV